MPCGVFVLPHRREASIRPFAPAFNLSSDQTVGEPVVSSVGEPVVPPRTPSFLVWHAEAEPGLPAGKSRPPAARSSRTEGPGYDRRTTPKWRNWQTRRTQNPVAFGPCGFDSHLRHPRKSLHLHLIPALGRSPTMSAIGSGATHGATAGRRLHEAEASGGLSTRSSAGGSDGLRVRAAA